MQADNVRLGEQRFQFNVISADISKRGILIEIIAENVHAKTCAQARQHAADFSRSNNADCLSVDVKAE